jgi:hypothetical protein
VGAEPDDEVRLPSDRVTVGTEEPGEAQGRKDGKSGPSKPASDAAQKAAGAQRLTSEQQRVVQELASRDREVRQHESAHMAAGGSLAGAPSYSYETGPDGKSYAVGGTVSIDLSPGRTPRETIDRARRIRAAALAPASPSAQDMSVASTAASMEARALAELAQEARAGASPEAKRDGEAAKVLRIQPGGGAHLHASDGCLACSKGVAYYRSLARSA